MEDDKQEKWRRVQEALDSVKTQDERNKMGQFATPSALANDILEYAERLLPKEATVSFLDPALGSGSFYSALIKAFPSSRVNKAVGVEIDPHYSEPAKDLWGSFGLSVRQMDFTTAEPLREKFNLIICNPPYVRHHHLSAESKTILKKASFRASGMQLSGLAGLYCHFLGLTQKWMEKGALAGWLIPSEFMDVNYGSEVKRYLLDKVTLLHIHRFNPNDVQFGDALVSSAVVWFKNEKPPEQYDIEFSYSGTLTAPRVSRLISSDSLRAEKKWTRFPASEVRTKETSPILSDFFNIRRGLATGDNNFFILTADEITKRKLPMAFFKPILPSPRYLKATRIKADQQGNPILDKPLFLLDCRLEEPEIQEKYPALFDYLQEGKRRGVYERYLCNHRSPWYSQENRPAAPFVCTYLGREKENGDQPFRFILNESQATVTNVYLALYPKAGLEQALQDKEGAALTVWKILNEIGSRSMLDEGRVYGGGLCKMEPKELANVPAIALSDFLRGQAV